MFDPTKPVQTRGGYPARIICTDRKNDWPIIALVTDQNGREAMYSYNSDGTTGSFKLDLINKTQTGWINIYPDGIYPPNRVAVVDSNVYSTHEDAVTADFGGALQIEIKW